MTDKSQFSQKLLDSEYGNNDDALGRIATAKRRTQSILDRETVACQKTLEQKIGEQGPEEMRVDPHLVGAAIMDLTANNRLTLHRHPNSRVAWYANPGTAADTVRARLDTLAPLYTRVSGDGFGNHTGDALEVIVWKCLREVHASDARYGYQGHFDLLAPKNAQGRFRRFEPPQHIGDRSTTKVADFFQFGHAPGPLCIECKNLREWMYPHHQLIKELILKSSDLGIVPLLVARRLHYTTKANLLAPAGIIAHESLFQYFPSAYAQLASEVRHARSLGFTDVVATEEPHPRTVRFFKSILPSIVDQMAERWFRNQQALLAYAHGDLHLAQLYNEIGSPAAGNWRDLSR